MTVGFDIDTLGRPTYNVLLNGTEFILPSPLGLVTDYGDFTQGMALQGASAPEEVRIAYELPNIKKSRVEKAMTRRVFTLAKDSVPVLDVEFMVADNDAGFRYNIRPHADVRSARVLREASAFRVPEESTTFMCPQSKPMGGFARTSPSYETPYVCDGDVGANGWGEGYTFPCLFRTPSGWLLLSETGVDGSYCGSRLLGGDSTLYTIGFPQPGEMNGLGSVAPGISLPARTPWRTITAGATLAPVVETTVATDLVEPVSAREHPFVPGKGTWSWIMKMDQGTTFDVQKQYIDFAAEMGYSSVLIDALWDTQIGRDGIARLARYGKDKGVALYLWYNSNGRWNDAPQGPRGFMDSARARRSEMDWMRSLGVRGIKVDFFGGDKQEMMQLYEDILRDAADYGLQVIFHGCTLPRGWERMFPAYASSEAVLASENMHFGQGACDAEAFNACMHPFVRNAVGSMDFGGSALNSYYNADNTPGRGSRRVTSDVFALATSVLFQSAVQHFALAPNNLTDAPAWAIGFMKEVPSAWDDIRFIDGYPGSYVVIARRCGTTWYVAGVNAGPDPGTPTLDLFGIIGPRAAARLYSDDQSLHGGVRDARTDRRGCLKVTIPVGGGMVAVAPSHNETI